MNEEKFYAYFNELQTQIESISKALNNIAVIQAVSFKFNYEYNIDVCKQAKKIADNIISDMMERIS